MQRIVKAELTDFEAIREIFICTFVETFAHLNSAADFKIYLNKQVSRI